MRPSRQLLLLCSKARVQLPQPTDTCRQARLTSKLIAAQDVSGGRPKRLSSTDLPIWGMEIDPEAARDEMRAARASSGNTGDSQLKGVLGPLGMGGLADQIGDLKLGAHRSCPLCRKQIHEIHSY